MKQIVCIGKASNFVSNFWNLLVNLVLRVKYFCVLKDAASQLNLFLRRKSTKSQRIETAVIDFEQKLWFLGPIIAYTVGNTKSS